MMKRVVFIITILILLIPSLCFAETYSVQTATYSLVAKKYALRHFDYLKKLLKDSPELRVRLLKGKKYLVVRIGDFKSYKNALDFIKKLKGIVKDPFVLNNLKDNSMEILREEGTKKEKIAKKRKTSELIRKETLRKAKKENPRIEEKVVYTIEIENFNKVRNAIRKLKELKEIMPANVLTTLRVERHGDNYSLRIGAFKTYDEAKEFLKKYKEKISGLIIQAKYGPRGVVFSYSDMKDIKEAGEDVQTDEQKEVDQVIATVESQLDDEDFGRAAAVLREAVRKWPDNSELHALYGETLLNMGFATNAYREYKKAIEISPDVSEYHSGLGYSLLNIYMERAQQAIDAFKKALEIDPDNVDALEGLGTVYVSIDRKDLAEDIYLRLKELDPVSAKRLKDIIDSGIEIGQ